MQTDTILDLVGDIYDCAIDPLLWPDTIRKIAYELAAVSGGIVLFDYNGGPDRLLIRDSIAPTTSDVGFQSLLVHVKPFQRPILGISKKDIDEPIIMPSFSQREEELRRTRFFRQWAEAQGIHQTMQSVALLEPTRLGIFGVNRHVEQGSFGDDEIKLMRRLAPHIRRSFVISDLLALHVAESGSFSAVLETLPAGICIVGAEGTLLHANAAAKAMLDRRHPIRLERGCLRGPAASTTAELLAAIQAADGASDAIGAAGIGIPLTGPEDSVSIAHVLPLSHGEVRPQLAPTARAAVFISPGPVAFNDLGAIARAFELTPAENRLVDHLMKGRSLADVAAALKITSATARTHLKHIFEKTGVSRQADLISLIHRLLPIARRQT